MISFRFHVVSLTAVFLAIAVGVVVGTTYVDRAVVENLENRIDTVSENLDERRAQIAELEAELGELQAYAESSAEFAVTDRLVDVPVVLFAVRGVDGSTAEHLATLVRRAGARCPGIVWLEPSWELADDEVHDRLAAVVGDDAERRRGDLVRQALGAMVTSLSTPDAPDALVPGRALLDALVANGFLSVDGLGDDSLGFGDLAGLSPRLLLLTGAEAEDVLSGVVPELARRGVDGGLSVVVADAFVAIEDGPPRGEAIWSALAEDVREQVVVVDAADRPEGRAAAVVGLAEAAAGRPGRYGYGPDTDSVLPAWAAP